MRLRDFALVGVQRIRALRQGRAGQEERNLIAELAPLFASHRLASPSLSSAWLGVARLEPSGVAGRPAGRIAWRHKARA